MEAPSGTAAIGSKPNLSKSRRSLTGRKERMLDTRFERVVMDRRQQTLGTVHFGISFALFLPVALTGWFPAISFFVFGMGLLERDGLLAGIELCVGMM
jgi:hypothetical protein